MYDASNAQKSRLRNILIFSHRSGVTIGSQRQREALSRDEERHLRLLEGVYQMGSGFSRRVDPRCSDGDLAPEGGSSKLLMKQG